MRRARREVDSGASVTCSPIQIIATIIWQAIPVLCACVALGQMLSIDMLTLSSDTIDSSSAALATVGLRCLVLASPIVLNGLVRKIQRTDLVRGIEHRLLGVGRSEQ